MRATKGEHAFTIKCLLLAIYISRRAPYLSAKRAGSVRVVMYVAQLLCSNVVQDLYQVVYV